LIQKFVKGFVEKLHAKYHVFLLIYSIVLIVFHNIFYVFHHFYKYQNIFLFPFVLHEVQVNCLYLLGFVY